MGPTALLPLRRKACWGFFALKNPTASAGFEPANLGTKGQHATSRPPKPHHEGLYPFPHFVRIFSPSEDCSFRGQNRDSSGIALPVRQLLRRYVFACVLFECVRRWLHSLKVKSPNSSDTSTSWFERVCTHIASQAWNSLGNASSSADKVNR